MAEASTQRHRDTEVAGRACRPATADGRARTPAAPHDGRAASMRPPWPRVKLGEVCEEKIDRVKKLPHETIITYIDIGSVCRESKKIISTTDYPVEEAPGRAQQLVQDGDLLVSTVRPNLNAVALVERNEGKQLVASTGFCVLRSRQNLDPRFVYYYSQTDAFIEPLVAVSEKASYPSVTDAIVKDSSIPLPPLPVQREIVARLERELGAVDELAKKFEELEQTAEAEFKAELKETFEEISRGGEMHRRSYASEGTFAEGEPAGRASVCETRRLGDVCVIKTGKKDVRQGNPSGRYPFFTCAKKPTFSDTYSFDCPALLVAGNGDVGYTQKLGTIYLTSSDHIR